MLMEFARPRTRRIRLRGWEKLKCDRWLFVVLRWMARGDVEFQFGKGTEVFLADSASTGPAVPNQSISLLEISLFTVLLECRFGWSEATPLSAFASFQRPAGRWMPGYLSAPSLVAIT